MVKTNDCRNSTGDGNGGSDEPEQRVVVGRVKGKRRKRETKRIEMGLLGMDAKRREEKQQHQKTVQVCTRELRGFP